MEEKELIEKVNLYLNRVKTKDEENYKLKEEGSYRIIGGAFGRKGNREEIKIVEGRFIDAIIYAIKQPKFYGTKSHNDPGEFDSGKIEKVEVQKLKKNEGLIKKLKN